LLSSLAHRLNLPDDAVRTRYNEIRSNRPAERRPREAAEAPRRTAESVLQLTRGRLSYDEKLECDLLETLMASPELLPFVTNTLETSDFRHPAARDVLEHLVKVSSSNPAATFETFLTSFEGDVDLKSLAVWLDEQARMKDVGKKLRESGVDETDGCPRYLRRALDALSGARTSSSSRPGRQCRRPPRAMERPRPTMFFVRRNSFTRDVPTRRLACSCIS
jgi:hypothetical protein